MNNQPLFSVLIANYNNGVYLMDAINSVLGQSYSNWEIIIVDDCSTDNSEDLYTSLVKDSRIHIYHNDFNMGCGYTKGRCVDFANGEIAGFLDPDDSLVPDAISKMVYQHSLFPTASLIYSTHFHCDENLNKLSKVNSVKQIPDGTDYLHYQRGAVNHFATFKINLYRNSVGINPVLLRAVDQDLYYLLEEQGQLHYFDEPLYLYRHHNRSISLFSGLYKARYWHLVTIYEACKRRGIISDSERIAEDLLQLNIGDVMGLSQEVQKYRHPHIKDVLRVIKRFLCKK